MSTIGNWYNAQNKLIQFIFNILTIFYNPANVSEWLGYKAKNKKIGRWNVILSKTRKYVSLTDESLSGSIDLPPHFYGDEHNAEITSNFDQALDKFGMTPEEKTQLRKFCETKKQKE